MMNEQCWVLIGGIEVDLWWGSRIRPTEGAPASVAFDAEYVIERDEKYKDIVGFIHTHPSFTADYSSRDDRTMKAWVTCLGRPLVCCIHGTDGLRAWWYLNDEDPPVEYQVKATKGLIFGLTPEEFFDEEEAKEITPTFTEEEKLILSRPTVEGVEGTNAAESRVEPTTESCSGQTPE